MNQLELGSRAFNVVSGDGKANPVFYLIEQVGVVDKLNERMIGWKHTMVFTNSEGIFLKPDIDGFTYYFSELPNMESYKDGNYYKVPTKVLKEHMKTYKSPWSK
ncbi:hypothetical protein ACQUY5_31285 [Bacillus cereus]|uniref:hypothetical protein n=1 Tax=Bacillus cereus TaxID=1396 RepID=UPI003D179BB5